MDAHETLRLLKDQLAFLRKELETADAALRSSLRDAEKEMLFIISELEANKDRVAQG